MDSNDIGIEVIINFLIASIVIVVSLVCLLVPITIPVGNQGKHTGYVTAVEKSGLFIKKYRVYFKTDVSSSQEDEYCIPLRNEEIVTNLISMQEKREQITIEYKENIRLGVLVNSECSTEIVGFKKIIESYFR